VVGAGGGSVDSPNSTTDGDGEASTRWSLGSDSPNTVNAVVSGVGVVTFTAFVTGSGGAGGGGGGGGGGGAQPARLEFRVQPSDVEKDKNISPPVEVVVLDASGNRFTARDLEIKLELTGNHDAKLRGDSSRRTSSGVATFSDLRVDRAGEYELHASAEGLPSVASAGFQVEDDKHGGQGRH
jgi:hypothetical protein